MRKKILCIFGILFFSLACFMGCNISADLEEERTSAIAFAPSVPKDFEISSLHWKYYCSTELPDLCNTDNLDWKDFKTKSGNGLGVIKTLPRDAVYYVGLRAYDSNAKPIWEGFYLNEEEDVPETITVSNKTQLVKIDGL